jgi:hypothetical protein
MEAKPQAETPPVRRLRTPEDRRALWQGVQQIWRKRGTDAPEVLAQMRDEMSGTVSYLRPSGTL